MKRNFYLPLAMLVIASFTSCEEKEPDNGNIIIVDQDISESTTWISSKTYVIEYGVSVNANLTIEPGTVIKFKSGTWLEFGGTDNVTLTANGTAENPIIFTSYSSNPAPGAWEGLWFYGNTLSNSSMTYCEIKYAGQDNYPALNFDAKITFNNCKVSDSKKNAIYSLDGFVAFNGNTIENVGTHAIDIASEAVHTLGSNNTIACESGYGIKVRGGSLNGTSTTWKKQTVPYYIDGGIDIDQTLTIEAGTILKFSASSWLSFGSFNSATLNATGPIVFTSAATTPAPGAWEGLFFYSNTSSNSKMEFCIVEFAGKENDNANITLIDINGLTIENCIIRKSSGYGVFSWNSTWNNINNTFEDNALGDIN